MQAHIRLPHPDTHREGAGLHGQQVSNSDYNVCLEGPSSTQTDTRIHLLISHVCNLNFLYLIATITLTSKPELY